MVTTWHSLGEAEHIIHRCSGPENGTPLVYLPGVHGCWTPLARAREPLSRAVRLIEVTYPLAARWTLDTHADELERLLDALGIGSAHLVGESFGSLVGWQFALSRAERTRSHLLVGGFCRAPPLRVAAGAGLGLELVWAPAFDSVVDIYVAWKRARGGRVGGERGVRAYPGVRRARGQRAVANRMRLIQRSDFRRRLGEVSCPVRYLGGERDRVVPVRREIATLERALPARARFASHLVARAPHMVIASHPDSAAERIARWVAAIERRWTGGDTPSPRDPSRGDSDQRYR